MYIVWGSTYLAIRVAVREGSGFPPFLMAGSRVGLSGLLLLGFSAWKGYSLRLSRSSWGVIIVSSILLWNGGNGLVTWAEQRAHSGYAALLVGTTPLWGALLHSVTRRRRPSLVLVASTLIGFGGLAVLTRPQWEQGGFVDAASTIALILAPFFWALGSAYQQHRDLKHAVSVIAGYQQIVASLFFIVMSFAVREPMPHPAPAAWWAWAYLVVIGSVFSYSAYVVALRELPLPVVMTYAYVNPVIAVLLGWLILNEDVTGTTILGMTLILTAVIGTIRDRSRLRL